MEQIEKPHIPKVREIEKFIIVVPIVYFITIVLVLIYRYDFWKEIVAFADFR